MPYDVVQHDSCPASRPWTVVKADTGEKVGGCHPTKAAAEEQMHAIGASTHSQDGKAERGVIGPHSTATTEAAWDSGAMEARLPAERGPLRAAHAWVDAAGDPDLKGSYKFMHHMVSTSGQVGAANTGACSNRIGVLNGGRGGADIPDGDRQGVYNHLAKHLRDAGAEPPELQAAASVLGEAGQLRAALVREQPGHVPIGAARSVSFPSRLEVRMVDRDGQQLYHLHGVATAYERPYEMWDLFGVYKEVVAAKAGAVSLAKPPDVAFLVNHKGVTMARTTNGTLELREEADGLHYDAYLNPKRQDVRDLVAAIEDRNVTESSFAFMITEGAWNDDYTEFRIVAYDIDRGDVSAVNYGANPHTLVAARGRELLADLDHAPTSLARAALERLRQRSDLATVASQSQQVAPPAPQPASQGRSVALVMRLLEADDD